jgi:hypothetical protein
MDKILPCKCGQKVFLDIHTDNGKECCWIECKNCGMNTGVNTKSKVIEAWNRSMKEPEWWERDNDDRSLGGFHGND